MAFLSILAMWSVFFLIIAVVGVVCYVLYAIPLYQLASRAGMENAWLAWIPVGNIYVLCMLSHNECSLFNQIHFSKRQNAFWAVVILLLAGIVLGGFPLVGGLISLACTIANAILMWKFNYDLLKTYKGSNADVMALAVVGTIISIVMLVELWMIRDNQPDYTYMG